MSKGDEMEKKKEMRSWTISNELWEEIKKYIPQKQREPSKHYQKALGQGQPGSPPGRFWKASSMSCGLAGSGKQSCGNMGAAAVFSGIFKNGKRQISLKRYGFGLGKI